MPKYVYCNTGLYSFPRRTSGAIKYGVPTDWYEQPLHTISCPRPKSINLTKLFSQIKMFSIQIIKYRFTWFKISMYYIFMI